MFNMDEATRRILRKYPARAADIANSFDPYKIQHKEHLVKQLRKLQDRGILRSDLRIYLIGGWYGNIMIPLIDKYLSYGQIRFIELDEEALYIAKEHYFKDHPKIKWFHSDATEIEFSGNRNLIINTSAEHMAPLNIKSGIIAVQSNDYYEIDDHTHCVDSADELENQYNFSKIWYKDFKSTGEYNRFMVIGRIRNED
jgi:SAM-dependent methyltransferase